MPNHGHYHNAPDHAGDSYLQSSLGKTAIISKPTPKGHALASNLTYADSTRALGLALLSRQKIPLPEGPDYRMVTRMRWECRCKGADDPDVLTVIRGADQAFVFPVSTPDKPRRDKARQRLLDPAARRKVGQILGNRLSWWQGGYSLIQTRAEPPNIGLVFRKGKDEVVLFFTSGFDSYAGHVNGTLNGQHISDLLDKKPSKQMQEWRRRYAQPELALR